MNFFTQQELETLRQNAKQAYDKNDPSSVATFDILKSAYEKLDYWAKHVQEKLFPEGFYKIRKNPLNTTGSKFMEYLWAQLFPSKDEATHWLAFLTVISCEGTLDTKIDTFRLTDADPKRQEYLAYRGDHDHSRIVKRFSFEEVLSKDWDWLISETVAYFQQIRTHYDQLLTLDPVEAEAGSVSHSLQANPKFYKYSPGERAKFWPEVYRDGLIYLGFEELGLGDANQYASQEAMNKAAGYDKLSESNRTWNLWLFAREARQGDVILANRGLRTVVGVGLVAGDYQYLPDKNEVYPHHRPVEWITNKEVSFEPEEIPMYKTLFRPDTFTPTLVGPMVLAKYIQLYPELEKVFAERGLLKLINTEAGDQLADDQSPMNSLNMILYGPPGTGKTYRLQQLFQEFTDSTPTISRDNYHRQLVEPLSWGEVLALALTDLGSATVPELRQHPLVAAKFSTTSIKHESQRIWGALQIQTVPECESVKLTEQRRHGIPLFWKEEDSSWRLADGKSLADDVPELVEVYENYKNGPAKGSTTKRYAFTTCHQSLSYEDFIEGIKPVMMDADASDTTTDLSYEMKDGIFFNACDSAAQLAGFANLNDCLKVSPEERARRFAAIASDPKQRYCLFLDEINRANVSAVFGEIITLLEEDKRLGQAREIIVDRLPYSKRPFGIPPNLLVIGTMNTADRSVEALDTALRRRFTFRHQPPEPDLLSNIDCAGIDLPTLLETINQRLIALKDADHTIGHAYFMRLREVESTLRPFALRHIFQHQLIPLLQEYFYGNYGKIRLVLGDAFVKRVQQGVAFAVAADEDTAYLERVLYEIVDLGSLDEGSFLQAVKRIYNAI